GEPLHVVALGHVGDEVGDFRACGFADPRGGGVELVLVPAGDDDVRARFGEPSGHGLSQALASARHQGRAALQIESLTAHLVIPSTLERPTGADELLGNFRPVTGPGYYP